MNKRFSSFMLVLVITTTTLFSGCGTKASPPDTKPPKSAEPVKINFAYWSGAGAESDAFDKLVAKFEEKNTSIKVTKQGGDFKDFYTKLETRIAGNDAPDATRIQYQQIGRYSSNGALLDITKKLPADYNKDFMQSLWSAVSYENSVYAIPQHTDTMAVFYNKDYFEKLGIKAPDKLEDAWTWDQFIEISKQLKEKSGAKYGFSVNWIKGNAYRWIPLLYQKGGTFLTSDLSKSSLNSPEGLEALTMAQKFFKDGLVPPGTSIKGTEDINSLFATGITGMILTGNWMASYFDANMKNYKFGVTYMPKGKIAASDLGGNALAVLKKAKQPEEALKFIEFMTSVESMKFFTEQGMFLPVRKSLSADKMNYTLKPELMKVFVEQSTTIPQDMAKCVTSPQMSSLNQILADELELVFTQNKDPKEALKAMQDSMDKTLKK